jgi:GTPase
MHAEFTIKSCFNSPGVGVIAAGEILEGQIKDGAQAKTPRGKIITVVRLDIGGESVHIAHAKDKVNIVMKGISISDVKAGMTIYFF